ncbi:hypothetical protein PAAG_03392 [Paracoccidioides lutzii Pb01]|uniref:Uncharacterized protein n=1 Tax=Paracoccidioides lutzii (strain ATCC MYA-826 / Pb01) TaxID=502779 RepID=C1GX18_PARBA|nr:hypothetical protein PAAG_03392 [Paracoccidioides lutzii Pb01]EEH41106.2 hypothetical protein PAAG_03392 [Paracoccidioides lutzii Pb01]
MVVLSESVPTGRGLSSSTTTIPVVPDVAPWPPASGGNIRNVFNASRRRIGSPLNHHVLSPVPSPILLVAFPLSLSLFSHQHLMQYRSSFPRPLSIKLQWINKVAPLATRDPGENEGNSDHSGSDVFGDEDQLPQNTI